LDDHFHASQIDRRLALLDYGVLIRSLVGGLQLAIYFYQYDLFGFCRLKSDASPHDTRSTI
jgi:hypothetical protein